jgi:hypothetical protein
VIVKTSQVGTFQSFENSLKNTAQILIYIGIPDSRQATSFRL